MLNLFKYPICYELNQKTVKKYVKSASPHFFSKSRHFLAFLTTEQSTFNTFFYLLIFQRYPLITSVENLASNKFYSWVARAEWRIVRDCVDEVFPFYFLRTCKFAQ